MNPPVQARQRLDLYLATQALGVRHAADVVLEETNGRLIRVGFRYRPDYIAEHHAFSIDPAQLPLREGEFVLSCSAGSPAFIDDYLPDLWGRRVLTRLAALRQRRRYDANSVIDSLALMGGSRIGALCLVPEGAEPVYDIGQPVERLGDAEQAAQHIDDPGGAGLPLHDPDIAGLVYLANSGTGVGGARPKALLYDDTHYRLAKFNRRHGDDYNNARVELACLRMARSAGLDVGDGRVEPGINGREVLLLERFDIDAPTVRHHLITVNGLLKTPASQSDIGAPFRYDNVHDILQRYSVDIGRDITRLVTLMLFNSSINNTDDHERNVSLIHRGDGFRLAPAYDLVPSIVTGAYHAAGFGWRPNPPTPTEATRLGRIFGLSKGNVAAIADRVVEAIADWPLHAEAAGVSDHDRDLVARYLRR